MPYHIAKKGSKWCVIGPSRTHGCHETRAKAIKQQRALYRAEKAAIGRRASAKESTVSEMVEKIWRYTSPIDVTTTTNSEFKPLVVGNGAFQTSGSSTSTVTVTLEEPKEEVQVVAWEGVLGLEGHPTADRRYLIPGKLSEREFPHPLMVQIVNDEGHKGSELGGRVEKITRISAADFNDPDFDLGELSQDAVIIWGEGVFDDSEAGQDGQRLIENGGGISFDLSIEEVQLLDPETFEPIDPDELELGDLLFGSDKYVTGIAGTIMGSTVVPFAAFPEAAIHLTASGSLVWNSFGKIRIVKPVLTASAAGLAPLKPPRDWFEISEPDEPTPLTVTEDGKVFGHLALWNQCHTSYKDYCQMPPRSPSEYKYFHLGEIETAEGGRVNVGKITVGTGHAPISYGSLKTLEHYDNTGCVAAFVRARDGKQGIWLSGAIRSDLPAEKIRDLRANPPSGDWRVENRALELQGVLSVPIPGFPVPRSEARLVASGEEEEIAALIASFVEIEVEEEEAESNGYPKADQRRELLAFIETNRIEWEADGFKQYSAEQRRKMAKDGRAMKDGSFPIADCQDAKNARQAIGRAPVGKRPSVRAHINKRERSLACKKPD